MRLQPLPHNTKDLLEFLRSISNKDPQELLSVYTQSLTLLGDDIHSLFIFLDYISLAFNFSELDEIEHLYTLFKVKLRKYKIFWLNYLKFEVVNRKKDFETVFNKVLEYLRFKAFDGKDELVKVLMEEKLALKQQFCRDNCKKEQVLVEERQQLNCSESINTNEDSKSENISNKMKTVIEKKEDMLDNTQNFSTEELLSSNIFTDPKYGESRSEEKGIVKEDRIMEKSVVKDCPLYINFKNAGLDINQNSARSVNQEKESQGKIEIKSSLTNDKDDFEGKNTDYCSIMIRSKGVNRQNNVENQVFTKNSIFDDFEKDMKNDYLFQKNKAEFPRDDVIKIENESNSLNSGFKKELDKAKSEDKAFSSAKANDLGKSDLKFKDMKPDDLSLKVSEKRDFKVNAKNTGKEAVNTNIKSQLISSLNTQSNANLENNIQGQPDNILNILSTPSCAKTWSDSQKTVLDQQVTIDNKLMDETNKPVKEDIIFELELTRSQETSKLRFSPNKRTPFRTSTDRKANKPRFVDIFSATKDNTLSYDAFDNTETLGHRIPTIKFKDRDLVVIKKIGKGGYSNVYKVFDGNETYALKVMRVEDQESLGVCLDEIDLLKKLSNCEFVIRMIDYETREECVKILLEYGEIDLQKLVKTGPLNAFYIKYIWESILRILVFIHSNKIVHRDIKPANFVLVRGKLKIIDFGISKSIKGDTTSILNIEKTGTLNYISPEQCSGRKVSRATDVWAAGCILYYLIYRKNVHNAKNVMDVLRMMAEETEIEYGPADDSAIESIKACLVYDPKKRAKPEQLLNFTFLKKSDN